MKPHPGEPTIRLRLKVPADLNCTGREEWKIVPIDRSIASLVWALQAGDVDMRGSCSGHGEFPGTVCLQDGRILVVFGADYLVRPVRALLGAIFQHMSLTLRRRFIALIVQEAP